MWLKLQSQTATTDQHGDPEQQIQLEKLMHTLKSLSINTDGHEQEEELFKVSAKIMLEVT